MRPPSKSESGLVRVVKQVGTGTAALSPRGPSRHPAIRRQRVRWFGFPVLWDWVLAEETLGQNWPDWTLVSPPLQSAAAAPSPVMGSIAPNDAMAAGPIAPGFFQV